MCSILQFVIVCISIQMCNLPTTHLVWKNWEIRYDIHSEYDLHFAGEKLIVTNTMRADMLSSLLKGHLGKCLARARDIMY